MADRYLKKEFREEVIEWQSFSNMLRDIAHLSQTEVDGIILWNRILVYATLFGYAEKVSQTLKGRDIQLEETNLALPDITMFGIQKPHCTAPFASKA